MSFIFVEGDSDGDGDSSNNKHLLSAHCVHSICQALSKMLRNQSWEKAVSELNDIIAFYITKVFSLHDLRYNNLQNN